MSSEEHAIKENLIGRSWAPALILVFGGLSFTMLLGTNWIRERLVITDMVRLDALVEFQLTATTVHLWLEEYVSGDPYGGVSTEEDLDRAAHLLASVTEGGEINGVAVPPLDDPKLESHAGKIAADLKLFAQVSLTRKQGFDDGLDVGIGSPLDIAYDHVFSVLRTETRALEASIRARLGENRRLAQILYRTILVSWLAIILIAVTGLWTRERRRRRAVQALAKSEAELIQAQKMDAVGRLANGITHDINNYLAAITANCELVRMQGTAEAEVRLKMDTILAVVGKASSLIDRLLAFSRQQPVQAKVVSLNEVITGLEVMMRRLAGEDTMLEIVLDGGLWNTKIDPSQLEQVLVNLLVNARQALPTSGSGSGRITIETTNVVLDESFAAGHATIVAGDFVMLAVTDTGSGIPAKIRDEIFEPFFTTKDKSTNSGLGLATVYGIARQNHGGVWVDSQPGKGATFKVCLPRVLADTVKETQIPPPPLRESGNECILLVEDNEDFRESAGELLIEFGYQVLIARDGKDALRVHKSNREGIDLVITDVVMPGMSGTALVDAIRSLGDTVPVLYISGYTDTVILDHGFVDGQVNLLRKPFSAEQLERKIREVLSAAPVVLTSGEAQPGTES